MAIPKFKEVLFEETGGVATVSGLRPNQLNAIRVGMVEETTETIVHASGEMEIGVIVLKGVRRKGILRRRRYVGYQVRGSWRNLRSQRAAACRHPRHAEIIIARCEPMPSAVSTALCWRHLTHQAFEIGVGASIAVQRRSSPRPRITPTASSGVSGLGFKAVALYHQADEAKEVGKAFRQQTKRQTPLSPLGWPVQDMTRWIWWLWTFS